MPRKTVVLFALVIALVALLAVWKPGSVAHTRDHASPERGASAAGATPPDRATEPGGAPPLATGPVALFGRVLEAGSDEPVPGAAIAAYDYEHARTLRTRSDTAGAFEFPDAKDARGAFHLVVAHERYERRALRYVRASREPVVVRLGEGGWLHGRVVAADGAPVKACRVSAVRILFEHEHEWDSHEVLYHQVLPDELAVAARQDVDRADGSFRIAGLAPGKYVLLVVAPGFAPRFENGGSRFDRYRGFEVREGAGTEVEIRLRDTAAYRVLVVDERTGDPLGDVRFHGVLKVDRRVTLVPVPAVPKGKGLYELRTALSKWNQLGSTKLVVSKEGYASGRTSFGGQDPGEVFRVVLGRGGTVRGHVWNEGQPVAGAILLFERCGDGAVLATTTSEADGFFEVTRLAAGEELVCHCYGAGLHRKLAAIKFRLKDDETRTFEIGAADSTAIQGRVRVRGEPAPDVLVAAYREGARVAEGIVADADREGWYRFESLEPGRYELFFNLGHAFLTRFVDLAQGQCLEVNIDASRVVKGVLLDAATGSPVTDQTELVIRATRQGSSDYAEASPGENGRFELWISAPGAYELDCPEGQEFYVRERPRVDLTQAREATGLRLFLVRDAVDGEITLHVVDAKTGRPIPRGWSRYQVGSMYGTSNWERGKEELDQCEVGRYEILVGADTHVAQSLEVAITPERKEIERTVALEPADAVRVVRLLHGSHAGRAGVQVGDLIVSVAGVRIRSLADLHAALEKAQGPFAIEYQREGKTITATLPAKPLGVEVQNVRLGD